MNRKEIFLQKRYNSEKRFKLYGKLAISFALIFLCIFLYKIFSTGFSAFQKTLIKVDVTYNSELLFLDENPSLDDIKNADYYDLALETMANLDLNADEDQQNELKRMVSYIFDTEIKNHLLKNELT